MAVEINIFESGAYRMRPFDGAAEGLACGDGRGDIHLQPVEQGAARGGGGGG